MDLRRFRPRGFQGPTARRIPWRLMPEGDELPTGAMIWVLLRPPALLRPRASRPKLAGGAQSIAHDVHGRDRSHDANCARPAEHRAIR